MPFDHYIIHQEGFLGHIISRYDPEIDQTEWFPRTLAEVQKELGTPVKYVTEQEIDEEMALWERGQASEPSAITEERWQYALEVLPPCRWHTHCGVEMFHVSEHVCGNMVDWFCRLGSTYCTFVDSCFLTAEQVALKAARIFEQS